MAGTLSGNTVTGGLVRTTGPPLGTPFDPNLVTRTFVGQATFIFTDPNHATLLYTVDGVSGAVDLIRFTTAPLSIDGTFYGVETYNASGCLNGAKNGSAVSRITLLVSTSGSTITIQELLNNSVCTLSGQYAQQGSKISAQGTFACSNGTGGIWSSNDISVLGNAFIAKTTIQYTTGETCHREGSLGGVK